MYVCMHIVCVYICVYTFLYLCESVCYDGVNCCNFDEAMGWNSGLLDEIVVVGSCFKLSGRG